MPDPDIKAQTLQNGHPNAVYGVAFSPDGRMALAQLNSGEILVYPSVDWTSPKPEESWGKFLNTLETLDVDQVRSWLNAPLLEKP